MHLLVFDGASFIFFEGDLGTGATVRVGDGDAADVAAAAAAAAAAADDDDDDDDTRRKSQACTTASLGKTFECCCAPQRERGVIWNVPEI